MRSFYADAYVTQSCKYEKNVLNIDEPWSKTITGPVDEAGLVSTNKVISLGFSS